MATRKKTVRKTAKKTTRAAASKSRTKKSIRPTVLQVKELRPRTGTNAVYDCPGDCQRLTVHTGGANAVPKSLIVIM